jgi:hypothetical protein
MNTYDHSTTLARLRRALFAIFLLGALGVGAELLLVGHTESWQQWIPLCLIGLSLFALLLQAVVPTAVTVRIFQAAMLLFMLGGGAGVILHYQGKVEFKLESNPALSGLELFREAVLGAAVPPVLAPGFMILLGLLGLAYAYRHPALLNTNHKGD